MKINFSGFKRDFFLFLRSPKDFLFSFKYSPTDKIKIKPFGKNSLKCADSFRKELEGKCKYVKLYLIGATGLKVAGRGDLDFYATVSKANFSDSITMISSILGEPSKVRKDRAEWNMVYRGYSLELVLTDPGNKEFKRQMTLFNLLKNNKKLLKEYSKIKSDVKRISEREYVKRRMEFFNRILMDRRS